MKNIITLIGLSLLIGACAQEPRSTGKAKFQNEAASILNRYARGVSSYMPKKASGVKAAYGPDLSWSDQPVGGYNLRPVTSEVADCLQWVQSIPEKTENYKFMVSAFSRCLNRVLSNQNPLMASYARNLPGQGQWDLAYAHDWRRPIPLEYFNSSQYNLYLPQLQNGFSTTQDVRYGSGY